MHAGIIFFLVILGSVLFHIFTPWYWKDIASNGKGMDDTITLTDEGYSAGSSGIKIFSGSTALTGAAGGQPQVQLRWKIVGTSLSNSNKIHGVALQWT